MPGVYAKPPKRAGFAKEINYMLLVLKKKETEKKWSEIMEVCVPMILDEFALERKKAREEARKDFEKQAAKWRGEAMAQQKSLSNHGAFEDTEENASPTHADATQHQKCGNLNQEDKTAGEETNPETRTTEHQRGALSLGELEARKERDVAEVFFVGGVHSAFCRILQLSSKEPEIGDVMPILMEYERLLLVEIDPYDIDITPLPLLIYFLSERHHFYVDIHWQHHELTLMENFLCALTSVLEPVNIESTTNCVVKKSIPTHSSGSGSDSSTSPLGCTQGLQLPDSAPNGTTAASSFPCPADAEKNSIPVPCSGASSGQLETTRVAVLKLLYRTLFTFPPHRVVSRMATVFDAARCRTLIKAVLGTSAFWESSRGLAQIAHTLAAIALFGLGAPMAAAAVPSSLLWAGASNLIRETRCPCSSCELQRRLLKACRMRDEVGVQEAAQDKRQIAYCLVRAGAPRLLQQLFLSLAQRQVTALKDTEVASVDGVEEHQISYIDQALQFSSWVLLLCSWPYEEMHARESLLAYDTGALLDSILDCLPTTHRGFLASVTAHERPGATSLLSATLLLLLRAPPASRDCLLLRANAVLYRLLVHIAVFVTKRDPYSPTRDKDALINEMSEEAEGTFKVSAAAGDKEISPHPKVEKEAEAPAAITAPTKAERPTPRVDVLLLAPVVMGLFQCVLYVENRAPVEPSSDALRGAVTFSALGKLKDSNAGVPPTRTDEAPLAGYVADASIGESNSPIAGSSAGRAPCCPAEAAAPLLASPAEVAGVASLTTGHAAATKSSEPNCARSVEERFSEATAQAPSQRCAAAGLLPNTSMNTAPSLIPENRRCLVSLGTAACQAFVHIYEDLKPLLATWEGFESRQDFQYCQSRHTSVASGQNSACEEQTREKSSRPPAGEGASPDATGGSSAVAASPSLPGSEAMSWTSTPPNAPFLPSRICLAPCLNTTAAGFDYRGFYYAVVSCMLTLVGGMRLQALPQNRWRFAENPAAGAGGTAAIGALAFAARKIIDFQKQELTEVCCYVKNAANLVIMRAEQASAISLRRPTTSPSTLSLLASKAGDAASQTIYPQNA